MRGHSNSSSCSPLVGQLGGVGCDSPRLGEKTGQLPLRQRTGFFRNDDQQKSGCIRDSKAARCWLGGFALSPICAVFLGGSRLGVKPAVKGSNPNLVPCLAFRERGTSSLTNKDERPRDSSSKKKRGPRRERMSGPS